MKKIQRNFYILGILLSITVILGLVIQYYYLNNIITKDKQLNITRSREHLSDQINNNIRYYSQSTISASEFIAMDKWTEEESMEYFNRLIKNNPAVKSVYFGDINNKLIISNDWIAPNSFNLRGRSWYTKAIGGRALMISDIYMDAIDDNPVVSISKSIYDDNGLFLGVVGSDISIEEIINMVENTTIKGLGYSFLIDSAGNILAHPRYKYQPDSELIDMDSISNGAYTELASSKVGQMEVELDGISGYLSYEPIEGTDWIICNFMSLEEYRGNGEDIWRMFFIAFAIAVVIFGSFTYLQRRNLILPLLRLDKDIGKVDLEVNVGYRIPMEKEDYFFDLRKSINLALNKTQELIEQNEQGTEEIVAQHDELEASYQQLSAMDQELRVQYDKIVESEFKLKYLSYYDQLTGLYNRRYFEEQLKILDNPKNLPLTLIMADVNGLKLINDSFGHSAGDKLLKSTASVIKKGCRSSDVIARIGGDEFVIILPHVNEVEAKELISRIKILSIDEKFPNMELSISFGFGTKYSEGVDISEILRKAEDDMYSQKLFEGPSMRSKTIDTIMKTLYEKNEREELHSKRVSLICQDIGIQLGMGENEIKELETVGLLHDIGKIAIDDRILEKTGPLDNEEWEEIKRHPEIGYRILSTVYEMSKIAEYTLSHHERYDGRGYPKGLKGEKIPLVSRIITIADSYDAMVSNRPYRGCLSQEEIIREFVKGSGVQFDPHLVRLFVEKVLGYKWIED